MNEGKLGSFGAVEYEIQPFWENPIGMGAMASVLLFALLFFMFEGDLTK